MISKAIFHSRLSWMLYPIYERALAHTVRKFFFFDLMWQTKDFHNVHWLDHDVWQSVLDLWTIQETIAEVKPDLIIETGTYRGGSALFYANLCDLLGRGRVVTIDVCKLHGHVHPRVEFWIGDSTSAPIVDRARQAVRQVSGPVMVILDSDHQAAHVTRELAAYAPLVTPGSYLLVQDGWSDTLWQRRPGPLVAIRKFLAEHPEYELDNERCNKFLITHHPWGWLRRGSTHPFSEPAVSNN